ncbi:hypothetical protein E9536_00015 [Burkholderia sp. LS-044]|uniref:hypothetical protein n=1 Tax=Burkholderia sp. LS-044 TaxID=1459967 RepID=UPI0010A63A97|nr:hypothetical protein [Burkholderia sp. LS-044]THJ56750.1 hypothetical protein E9536_00015 [Burkholderia sp. LS-044]
MRIASKLHDGRINATNYLIEISIGDYIDLARTVLDNNEFQRKRVSSSKTIYSLLKTDAVQGCVIPPIVLALSSPDPKELTNENLKSALEGHVDHLMILDGLQRSHSFIDIEDEFKRRGDDVGLKSYRELPIRCEIYLGINRLGILYRMLTLNTGQTPMSLRQQIEMLYLDYSKEEIAGVVLTREVDATKAKGLNAYNFKEVIEGFNCYLERNELPLERADLLENIKSLEKLSQENSGKDLFREFVASFHQFVIRVNELMDDESLDEARFGEGTVWGKTATQVFKKQQALAGFGAAIGKLKDNDVIEGFQDVISVLSQISIGSETQMFLAEFNKSMRWIADNAKKIGNAQRMYFQYYFRELFNPSGDGYLSLYESIPLALQKYKSQVF